MKNIFNPEDDPQQFDLNLTKIEEDGKKSQYLGFRLAAFSLLNWGTFDQKIWKMSPAQENSLLTGNIGSGKSTLVDGLTTLLVPTRKLSFNKAAGAEDKERSLESYFHGYYTSVQDDMGKARSVGLRQDNHYSVLMSEFYSSILNETVTLAQVFWLKPGETKVKRLFVVSHEKLSIKQHFSAFGSQIRQLKKQLRKLDYVQLFDTFPPYSQAFSKLLGLGADGKALELFNQTISMKSVGSVTDFVRHNMLEKPDIEEQLQELERNYDDLKRLHDVVVAARQKVELLTPVSLLGDEAIDVARQREHTDQCRQIIDQYIAKIAIALYQSRLEKRHIELQRIDISVVKLEQNKQEQDQTILELKSEILNNGGARIQQLELDIERKSKQRDDSRKFYHIYQQLTKELLLSDKLNPDTFLYNIQQAKTLVEEQIESIEQVDGQLFQSKTLEQEGFKKMAAISEQINALQQRKSNIHLNQLRIRSLLSEKLCINEEKLPFVGELLQVKKTAKLWQGAVERVLHNFALSLIVSDDLYQQVSQYVEQTHLGTRLVYYRVKDIDNYYTKTIDEESLLNKLEIKSDSLYYEWIRRELQNRFDYLCCDDMGDFRRSEKAITPNGQMKSGKFRHEKDDRYKLQDKSRYVLGWSNKEKIKLLKQQLENIQIVQNKYQLEINELKQKLDKLDNKRRNAHNLADLNFSFEQLNWPAFAQQIEQYQQEKQQLEKASDILKDLNKQLELHQQKFSDTELKLRDKYTEQGVKSNQISSDKEELTDKQALFNSLTDEQINLYFPTLDEFYLHYYSDHTLEIRSINNRSSEFKTKLNSKVQNLEEKRRKKEQKMIVAMGNFAHQFPNDVKDIDKSPQALPEYQQMLKQLSEEDLPRHESRFKEMLNRDTIRAMALFRSHLDKQEEEIDARIYLINQALHELDYQIGTYIEIDRIASPDIEVKDFKQRLKQCVEYTAD